MAGGRAAGGKAANGNATNGKAAGGRHRLRRRPSRRRAVLGAGLACAALSVSGQLGDSASTAARFHDRADTPPLTVRATQPGEPDVRTALAVYAGLWGNVVAGGAGSGSGATTALGRVGARQDVGTPPPGTVQPVGSAPGAIPPGSHPPGASPPGSSPPAPNPPAPNPPAPRPPAPNPPAPQPPGSNPPGGGGSGGGGARPVLDTLVGGVQRVTEPVLRSVLDPVGATLRRAEVPPVVDTAAGAVTAVTDRLG